MINKKNNELSKDENEISDVKIKLRTKDKKSENQNDIITKLKVELAKLKDEKRKSAKKTKQKIEKVKSIEISNEVPRQLALIFLKLSLN